MTFDHAIAAREKGHREGCHSTANIEAKYNTAYILTMAQQLPLPEIGHLLRWSERREYALRELRHGHPVEAGKVFSQLATELAASELSPQATTIARSFNTAAEAYYYYKMRNLDRAYRLMKGSIEAVRVLRDHYGHQVQVRLIHLHKNLLRLTIERADLPAAHELISELFGCLAGQEGSPATMDLHSCGLKLFEDERCVLADQVAAELCYLHRLHPESVTRNQSRYEALTAALRCQPELHQIVCLLLAVQASANRQWPSFYNYAIQFYCHGPHYFYTCWSALDRELERVHNQERFVFL